ncbi:DNA sulfur modification protein DndB [Arthrobacter sp. NPDC058130]|uniref:DNA sulfur modification protein DndB n=1 Tax=Arthrobacter sp. NPDC058130 TaxID=3346353 RepID=UPI0036E0699C
MTVIRHLRVVHDAGQDHYEGIMTGAWFADSLTTGVLEYGGNIRPDWQTDKMGAKTRRKVERWTEELLQNDAVMGNLSVRLDPGKCDFDVDQDEDGDWTLSIWSGHLDTAVDSQSRITSIIRAVNNPLGSFDSQTRFATRIWVADDQLAARVGSDYNTRGDKVNDTAAKFAYQDNAEKRIARALLQNSPHLGVDNVEVLKNAVSASSSKLFAFNTLTQAMESFWHGDPVNKTEEEAQGRFLVDYWDALVSIRPEFGRLGKTERTALRGTSMAGTALSIHGIIAIAYEIYKRDLNSQEVLAPLAEPVYTDGDRVDYFSYKNPVWTKLGALVDTNGKQQLRMSFQTRRTVAAELKRRLGLEEQVSIEG